LDPFAEGVEEQLVVPRRGAAPLAALVVDVGRRFGRGHGRRASVGDETGRGRRATEGGYGKGQRERKSKRAKVRRNRRVRRGSRRAAVLVVLCESGLCPLISALCPLPPVAFPGFPVPFSLMPTRPIVPPRLSAAAGA